MLAVVLLGFETSYREEFESKRLISCIHQLDPADENAPRPPWLIGVNLVAPSVVNDPVIDGAYITRNGQVRGTSSKAITKSKSVSGSPTFMNSMKR